MCVQEKKKKIGSSPSSQIICTILPVPTSPYRLNMQTYKGTSEVQEYRQRLLNAGCGETRQPRANPTGRTSLGGGVEVGEQSESLTMVKCGSLQGVMETEETLRLPAKARF